jgi:NAD(P)-dependent dehydrogenase (short-subunit alcohol dehydrogenase family)
MHESLATYRAHIQHKGDDISMTEKPLQGRWALILGASSGFGAATARTLAAAGMNIAGVHLDLRQTLPNAKAVIEDIEATGSKARFFNTNAADPEKRAKILDALAPELGDGRPIHVLMHSLAFGSLLPLVGEGPEHSVNPAQMDMTLNVMANSLVFWTQDLVWRGLLGQGSRIFSMTSEGSRVVVPNYGVVSAAKAALESHTRQLALELGGRGILVNCIQAGVTQTPAQSKIPGAERMVEVTLKRNPTGRLTSTQDVAATILALSQPSVQFISGSTIVVDGGESAVGGFK